MLKRGDLFLLGFQKERYIIKRCYINKEYNIKYSSNNEGVVISSDNIILYENKFIYPISRKIEKEYMKIETGIITSFIRKKKIEKLLTTVER